MIHLDRLTHADKGAWVEYDPGQGQPVELGRLKSWSKDVAFVVYRCDEQWDRYHDYTGQMTSPEYLNFAKPGRTAQTELPVIPGGA